MEQNRAAASHVRRLALRTTPHSPTPIRLPDEAALTALASTAPLLIDPRDLAEIVHTNG